MHDNDQLPDIVPGCAGSRIPGGRILDYRDKPERQLCRLFLLLMDKQNVSDCGIGDLKTMCLLRQLEPER